MSHFRVLVAAALLGAPLAFPVETRSWIHNDQQDFEKGTLKNLSLRSDGRVTLGPQLRELADPAIAYLWAIAVDSKGTVYAGGGGPSAATARLVAVDRSGKTRTVAELPGLQIQAIAVDRQDRVYAATAPDGKVYRVAADGKYDVFYDPKAKYIWALVFDKRGDLFVATGDAGEIHRVTADGKGSVFFRTEETHARSLAIDANDNLIAGTEPGGLIFRISPAGEGFVLYQAARREVTSVAVAPDGTIYAAAVGTRGATTSPTPTLSIVQPAPSPAQASSTPPGAAGRQPIQTVPIQPAPAAGASTISGGSEVYRIAPDGSPQRVWSHAQDIVYAVAIDGAGHPILGTGNKGNIYRIDSPLVSTLLINAAPTQITALASGAAGTLYAAAGNVGKVFQIGPGFEKQGTYESDPLDAGSFAYWGHVNQKVQGGSVKVETRSGNLDRPQNNWSPWAPLNASGRPVSPPARFLQYRITMDASQGGQSPELREIELAWMPKNAPPSIDEVEITPPNYRFNPPSAIATPPARTLTLPTLGARRRTVPTISLDTSPSSNSMQYAKGQAGARWVVTDPNGDDVLSKVEIRGVHEREWKLLRDKVKERYLSWDSTGYPDGEYLLRITASDAPDNPPDQALSTQLESERFTIDNTPPQISALAGTRSGSRIAVKWQARDARTNIAKAEYSVNGGDWIIVQPSTRLSDAPQLDYATTIDNAGSEATIAVRVTDEYDNTSVEKVVVQ